jgi:3-isopropylmalate/(R)-2-methylmalate dehydratase small subunit
MECDEAVEGIDEGNIVEINFDTGEIHNITKNETYKAQPFPDFIQNIINSGGLVEYVKKSIQ